MSARRICGIALILVLACSSTSVLGQTRDELVKQDKQRFASDQSWHYDNLQAGIEAALAARKPLMVVLRCIP